MNDQDNRSLGSASDVPPPLPSHRPTAGAPSGFGPAPGSSASAAVPPVPRSDTPLPMGVKGWCWGAFLLNWIWAIRFRVWWGLLSLVPIVGLAVPIWLGLKGRELAWRRRAWTSVEAFNQAQRKWSIAGAVLTVFACLGYSGNYAYEQWQARQDEMAAQRSGSTQDELTKSLSAPVDLKQLGVPVPAQTAPTVKGDVNVGDTLPNRIETNNGSLEKRTLPDQSSAIFLGGQQLFRGGDANWQELVRKFQRPDGAEVVLMRSSGSRGNSCEALYFFVVLSRSGIQYSPEFGSCTPAITYEQRGDALTLTMPRMGGMSTYQFGGDGKLLEDGKLVQMSDDIDPSK